jgi:hypothetical protein
VLTHKIFLGLSASVPQACSKDYCENIAKAVVGSCVDIGNADFQCRCQLPFVWDDDKNSCRSGVNNNYQIEICLLHI